MSNRKMRRPRGSEHTLASRQNNWRSSLDERMRALCHDMWPASGKKLVAISLVLVLALCLVLAEAGRATRSSIVNDAEEEELTIGQHFHQANLAASQAPDEAQEATGSGGGGGSSSDSLSERHTRRPSEGQLERTKKRENDFLDPFVFTFEDYLREASSGAGRGSDSNEASEPNGIPPAAAAGQSTTSLIEDDVQSNEVRQGPSGRLASLIIEDEENNAGPAGADTGNELHPRQHAGNRAAEGAPPAQQAPNGGEERARLSFQWRALPTNRCSRECGRGRRLNHLSCVDLKFNVRVESELCERSAELVKPSELGDESCNEFDCPPAWAETDFQQCDRTSSSAAGEQQVCHSKRFKKLACVMLNRLGQNVHLEESRCNASSAPPPTGSQQQKPDEDPLEEFSIDLGEQLDKERNSILSNELPVELSPPGRPRGSSPLGGSHGHGETPAASNEPFYQPTEWGQCGGAPCGQLGKRTRSLACRLYLARSGKFLELPESSCQANGARVPDREEPCYMDCGPGGVAEPEKQTHRHVAQDDNSVRQSELDDETIYDLEVVRHAWRHGGWTKCSAECLGGVHESIVECWDRVAETSVDSRHCDPLAKPEALRRACNEVPCAPEWRLGPFSECSRSCGSAGVRSRTVACVQQVPPGYEFARTAGSLNSILDHNHHHHQRSTSHNNQHTLVLLVPNELCLEQQRQQQLQANGSAAQEQAGQLLPHSIEPCNRHDCKPEWQVGPWGAACSGPCGQRNRSVICVQEFSSRDGPLALEANLSHAIVGADLKEAIQLASAAWHPGKAIQVPFSECYREYHSVPQLSEPCRELECQSGRTTALVDPSQERLDSSAGAYIDADPLQDYRVLAADGMHLNAASGMPKRRTVTLKIGGKAQLLEGRNVKIRCRVIRKNHSQLKNHQYDLVINSRFTSDGAQSHVSWRKDGVRIFAPNTTMADKQLIEETDNSILLNGQDDILSLDDKYSMMAADEPPESRARQKTNKFANLKKRDQGSSANKASPPVASALSLRSWPAGEPTTTSSPGSFQFVPRMGGRFSLVKENTLRIKKLRPDDSGTYTCSVGPTLSESIELLVISKRGRSSAGSNVDQQLTNYT